MNELLKSITYSIRFVWKYNKLNLLTLYLIQIINGFVPVVGIYLFQRLIDETSKFLFGKGSLKVSLLFLLLQISTLLFVTCTQFLNTLNEKYLQINIGLITKKNTYKKINRIPFLDLDNPNFYNNLQMISGFDTRLISTVVSVAEIIKYAITISSVLIYLLNISWILILILIIGIVPLFIMEVRNGNERFNLNKILTPLNRETGYVSSLLLNVESIKEIRLFNLTNHFIDKWKYLYIKSSQEEIKLQKKQIKNLFFTEVILVITYALASIWVVYMIKTKGLLVGVLVAVIQAIQGIQESLSGSIKVIATFYENSLYINKYHEFIEHTEIETNKNNQNIDNITSVYINNLSFRYPNQQVNTLKNISLSITPGKKIAIVGGNGSGKTTLIKCLTGLYQSDEDSITVNGMPISKLNLESFHKKISVLFQDFNKFQFTIRENIGVGDISKINDDLKLHNVLQKVGMKEFIDNLPFKMENRLGRLFEGGIELSGGQWQKIAISRSLFRESDLIILDEPTSAIDPKAEVEIIEELFNIAKDKSIVYITHRLGATWMADEIIVINDGEIVERGTHKELIALHGEYAELYNAQAKWYLEEERSTEYEYA